MIKSPKHQAWLSDFVETHGGVAGSVHTVADGILHLKGHIRLPPPVVARVQRVPRGKGMAGLAWLRDRAVQTCDLQNPEGDDVQPGARAVQAGAAVAIPTHTPDGTVRGVVGIAFATTGDLGDERVAQLSAAAESCP